MFISKPAFFLLYLLPVFSLAQADTVWMRNGDKLTGIILLLDNSKLLLKTEYAGTLSLQWGKVATLESKTPLLIKENTMIGEHAKGLRAGDAGTTTLVNGGTPKQIALSSVTQIMKPKPLVEDFLWKNSLDFAFNYKRGESETNEYDIKYRTTARHGVWRHHGELWFSREDKNHSRTTDNWGGEYALDHFVTSQRYWQGRLSYRKDRVEDLEKQKALGFGPGYQFWDDELGAFSASTLLSRYKYRYKDGDSDRFYALGVHWDYNRYMFAKNLELYSRGDLTRPLNNTANYAANIEVGLRYRITDWVALNVRANKERISGARENVNNTKYSIGMTVGW